MKSKLLFVFSLLWILICPVLFGALLVPTVLHFGCKLTPEQNVATYLIYSFVWICIHFIWIERKEWFL